MKEGREGRRSVLFVHPSNCREERERTVEIETSVHSDGLDLLQSLDRSLEIFGGSEPSELYRGGGKVSVSSTRRRLKGREKPDSPTQIRSS